MESACYLVPNSPKPPIKDTPKEDRPPNKAKDNPKVLSYTQLYRKSPLKEDNLSTEDKTAGPEGVLVHTLCMHGAVLCITKGEGASMPVEVRGGG